VFNTATVTVLCCVLCGLAVCCTVLLVQEWEAFTGLIVSDTKHESGKDIPNWIEPDRTPAILLLKVTRCICVVFMSTLY